MNEVFKALLSEHIPSITDEQAKKLGTYAELLLEWNQRFNLTAITDIEGVVTKHFADSLLPVELIPKGARCIDVGSGAGFPGVPLKIMRPDIELVLIDALNKRVGFLNELINVLQLDAAAYHLRAEEAARSAEFKGRADVALTRAVAATDKLCLWTLPLIKPSGKSLMFKGEKAAQELDEAQRTLTKLGAVGRIIEYSVPWGARSVTVVTFKKQAE